MDLFKDNLPSLKPAKNVGRGKREKDICSGRLGKGKGQAGRKKGKKRRVTPYSKRGFRDSPIVSCERGGAQAQKAIQGKVP